MIAERAAFQYALLRTDSSLYPRMVFRQRFPLSDADFGPATLEQLHNKSSEFDRQAATASGQSRAFLQLLVEDARRAIGFLEQHDFAEFDVEASIREYTDVAEDYLKERLGLDWHRAPSAVVEYYPPPFEDADWFAVAGAAGMSTASVNGIHFLRRHMMPQVVALATLHENTHHGTRGPGGYHRYFDEGIANFLAYTIYYDHTGDLGGVRLFHTFLDELNVLYAYPPMLRIMAAMVRQVGLAGLIQLAHWRANAPERIDWPGLLVDTRAGRLAIPAFDDSSLPPGVAALEPAATRALDAIIFPEKALASPVAYQVFNALCERGPLALDDVRSTWSLSESELDQVVRELEDHFVWNVQSGQLTLFGHSDFLHGTGILRAQAPTA